MAVNEADKHDLFQALVEKLGQKRAETFMNLVTTVPWSEVATKADLERFATKADLRAETERMARKIIQWVSGAILVVAGLAFAAGRTL